MSAGDVYLQIVEDDKGRPILHYHGREFAVLQAPRVDFNYEPYGMGFRHRSTDVELSIRACLIEPEPEPERPKRTWATTMGLRKPK